MPLKGVKEKGERKKARKNHSFLRKENKGKVMGGASHLHL